MKKFIPKGYKNSVFDIDYKRLKKKGIKCLLFDLDNTLLPAKSYDLDNSVIALIKQLTVDFKIIIISNSTSRRLKKIKGLEVAFYSFSLKPLKRNFKKIIRDYKLTKEEMVIIGDQFLTDILGGNRMGITTILVNPLSGDLVCTKINRFLEEKIVNKLGKRNLFFKGKYYE
ncbi:MAG: YqeG family HAD IIIA-type phosphatase [Bacilli bacterium]